MPMIDVSDLKEWVQNWFYMNRHYHPYGKTNNIPIPELYDILERMPTIDSVPVARAEWKLDSDALPICSNCGEIALQRVFVKMPHLIQDVRMVRSNFCPNCGAKMERKI